MPAPKMIVFTDLDGTLLDHETYAYEAALPALNALQKHNIPVILATSKTAAEVMPLRDMLGIANHPAIIENGAGILPPGAGSGTSDQHGYHKLRALLDALPTTLRSQFQGFGDWGPSGIAKATGLSPEQAELAAQRRHSEPGLWGGNDSDLQSFITHLRAQGVHAREGGRFLTLSFGATKASQMEVLTKHYTAPFCVALGDAPNDVEMLEQADLAVILPNPHRPALPALRNEQADTTIRAIQPGPHGWNAAMLHILSAPEFNNRTETSGG